MSTLTERIQSDHAAFGQSVEAIEALLARGTHADGGEGTREVLDFIAFLEGDLAVHLELEERHLAPLLMGMDQGEAVVAQLAAGSLAMRDAVSKLEEAIACLAVGDREAPGSIAAELARVVAQWKAHVARLDGDLLATLDTDRPQE